MAHKDLVIRNILYPGYESDTLGIYILVDTPFWLFLYKENDGVLSSWYMSSSEIIPVPFDARNKDHDKYLHDPFEIDFERVLEESPEHVQEKIIMFLSYFPRGNFISNET